MEYEQRFMVRVP